MLNYIVQFAFDFMDAIVNIAPINSFLTSLDALLSYLDHYVFICSDLFKGIFFIVGKDLVTAIITFFIGVVACRVVLALVNVIGQFIP